MTIHRRAYPSATEESMRAAVYRRYGPPEVVRIEEVPDPTPRDDEVLVRVRATTVSAGDRRMRSADVPPGFGPLLRLAAGITGPRNTVLGTEIAGEVVAVGSRVSRFRVGDRVFALCGTGLGGHAELRALRETAAIAHLPSTWSFEEGATLAFGGTTALFFLRDQTRVRAGEKVLIVGASGAVGTAMVQLARQLGAEVTGVCSGANADLVRRLGAAHVIDYTRKDFTTSGRSWDVILDAVGNHPYPAVSHVLAPGGRLGQVVGSLADTVRAALRPRRGAGHTVVAGVAPERGDDLRTLAELAETGALKPVIDSVYPFDRIVDAHRRVDTHRKVGSVVVTVSSSVGEGAPPRLDDERQQEQPHQGNDRDPHQHGERRR
jgi:NADPH:quinone reductase-like Zn-dependent oxidoreductase